MSYENILKMKKKQANKIFFYTYNLLWKKKSRLKPKRIKKFFKRNRKKCNRTYDIIGKLNAAAILPS